MSKPRKIQWCRFTPKCMLVALWWISLAFWPFRPTSTKEQHPQGGHFNKGTSLRKLGWSEPAATNAPVEDEPVQPVLRMNILPACRDFLFHLLSAPKFSTSPLLPTTSQPHPPSLHHQNSRDLERLWSESWSCGCGAGARAAGTRAGPAGIGAGPTRPRKGKMLTFFFFVLRRLEMSFFFCSRRKRRRRQRCCRHVLLLPLSLLHCSLAAVQQRRRPFSSFSFFAALQLNCSAAKKKAFFFFFFATKKRAFFFFFFTAEEKEEEP